MSKVVAHPTKSTRGGKRHGAGRPHGSGKYGEPTKAIRVPQSLIGDLQQFLTRYQSPQSADVSFLQPIQPSSAVKNKIPFYLSKIPAGFPSPADDYQENQLDLNDYVVKNPTSTFYVRVEGNSMLGAGIHPNDVLVVDLSIKAADGNIIVAYVDGEFTVKRLQQSNERISLLPENEDYQPLHIKEGMDFRIWGVVTHVIHHFS